MGFDGARRRFPGFAERGLRNHTQMSLRQAYCTSLAAGDLLSLQAPMAAQEAHLLVYDTRGRLDPEQLGLTGNSEVATQDFQADAFVGWIDSNGGITPK